MSIRIRRVNGLTIALCAAETDEQPGDLYLDDNAHHALTTKFGMDFKSMDFMEESHADRELIKVMALQKREGVPLTIEEAHVTGLCRYCRGDVRQNLPLILNYGQEYAHEKCVEIH